MPPKSKLKRCLESSKWLRTKGKSRRDGNRRKHKREKNSKLRLRPKLLLLSRTGKGEQLKKKNGRKTRSVLSCMLHYRKRRDKKMSSLQGKEKNRKDLKRWLSLL